MQNPGDLPVWEMYGSTSLIGAPISSRASIVSSESQIMTAPDVRSPDAPLHSLLVVEDDILIRFQICDYLRECGFKVIEVANANEAIFILSEPELRVDLVLSNVKMPGSMDGFGLAQWMRKEKPGVPIILAG